MHSIPPTSLTQPVDKRPPRHPKIRTNQPIPLPKQMLAQPLQTPTPKEALSLPEPTVQSQENVQPQHHMPIPLTQYQPVDPKCIMQPIGPKIQHRPSPPYQSVHKTSTKTS